MLLQDIKRREKNLAMGWIDNRKDYDMIPHSWVIESLSMMGIAKNVVNFGKKDDVQQGRANLWF